MSVSKGTDSGVSAEGGKPLSPKCPDATPCAETVGVDACEAVPSTFVKATAFESAAHPISILGKDRVPPLQAFQKSIPEVATV